MGNRVGEPTLLAVLVGAIVGIREAAMTTSQPGIQVMTAHAVDLGTGDVIDAEVDLPPLR